MLHYFVNLLFLYHSVSALRFLLLVRVLFPTTEDREEKVAYLQLRVSFNFVQTVQRAGSVSVSSPGGLTAALFGDAHDSRLNYSTASAPFFHLRGK